MKTFKHLVNGFVLVAVLVGNALAGTHHELKAILAKINTTKSAVILTPHERAALAAHFEICKFLTPGQNVQAANRKKIIQALEAEIIVLESNKESSSDSESDNDNINSISPGAIPTELDASIAQENENSEAQEIFNSFENANSSLKRRYDTNEPNDKTNKKRCIDSDNIIFIDNQNYPYANITEPATAETNSATNWLRDVNAIRAVSNLAPLEASLIEWFAHISEQIGRLLARIAHLQISQVEIEALNAQLLTRTKKWVASIEKAPLIEKEKSLIEEEVSHYVEELANYVRMLEAENAAFALSEIAGLAGWNALEDEEEDSEIEIEDNQD